MKALLSVYKKEGIEEIAKVLKEKGWDIYASSGTMKYLADKGIETNPLSSLGVQTEGILGGRIKTLHPAIFERILAREQDDIEIFSLMVVNLYPFEEVVKKQGVTEDEIIENIDIGGVALIRAGVKNYRRIAIVTDPHDYKKVAELIREKNEIPLGEKTRFARKAVLYTSWYDSLIYKFFAEKIPFEFDERIVLSGKKIYELRYGENPHQKGSIYSFFVDDLNPLQGKRLSYNNLLDTETAFYIVSEFEEPACAIIKHTSPCGVACDETIDVAFERAYLSDPQSAFGGIVGINKTCTKKLAEEITNYYFEVLIAPDFEEPALEILKEKKRLRLIKSAGLEKYNYHFRECMGLILFQEKDAKTSVPGEWELKTWKKPKEDEIQDLIFAWKVVKYVKSNAVVLAKAKRTLGIGGGQPSRVGALEVAIQRAKNFGIEIAGGVLASDAFFPFKDSIELAANHGITAIVVPGGSIRDKEVVEEADRQGISLFFTKERHFRH